MIEFILAFFVLLSIVAMMSIGVMRGRAPITGSCGGLNAIGVEGGCEICGGDPTICEEKSSSSASFYRADSEKA